nr:hypothetical protein [Tanacetum cinerariifolium]
MITDEMKLKEHYRMYAKVFGIDVPTSQLQPIESTHGTHRKTSTPRSPNPDVDAGESRTYNVGSYEVDSFTHKNDNQNDLDTMLEPMSNKESTEMEKTIDVSQPVNVIEEEDDTTEDDYELRRREKGKKIEETRNTPPYTPTRSTRIHYTLIYSDLEKL